MPTWLWIIIGLIPSLPFLLFAPALFQFLHTRRLVRVARSATEPSRWPAVSILVAARDEEEEIERAIRSLAALDYPDFEVIAVDDRSRDRSGAILDSIAADSPNVRVLHVRELPAGWLGKPHALHCASQLARGEYLLFTDADVIFEPEVLSLTMRHVAAEDLDHLSLIPRMSGNGYWERVTMAFFGFFAFTISAVWAVRNPRSRMHSGLGAFNLVRASTYRDFGGHQALRAEVIDDAWLGRVAKAYSGRCDVLMALEQLRLRWQRGAFGVVRGLEKNIFAAFRFSTPLAVVAGLIGAAMLLGPVIACALFADERALGFAFGGVAVHIIYMETAAAFALGRSCVFGFFLGALLLLAALVRSLVMTLARRGVVWRDTYYPLAQLRTDARRLDRDIARAFAARLAGRPVEPANRAELLKL